MCIKIHTPHYPHLQWVPYSELVCTASWILHFEPDLFHHTNREVIPVFVTWCLQAYGWKQHYTGHTYIGTSARCTHSETHVRTLRQTVQLVKKECFPSLTLGQNARLGRQVQWSQERMEVQLQTALARLGHLGFFYDLWRQSTLLKACTLEISCQLCTFLADGSARRTVQLVTIV